MKKSRALLFLVIVVSMLFLLSSCDQTIETGTKYCGIKGTVKYSNGDDHSGILITLDKTDGLRAITLADGSKAVEAVCYTKADGSFTFYNLTEGTYTIYASSNNSLEKAVSTNVYVAAGKTVTIDTLQRHKHWSILLSQGCCWKKHRSYMFLQSDCRK